MSASVLGIDEEILELGYYTVDEECGEASDHIFLIYRKAHPAFTDSTLGQGQPLWVLQEGASIILVRQGCSAKHAFKVQVIGKCGVTEGVRHCLSVAQSSGLAAFHARGVPDHRIGVVISVGRSSQRRVQNASLLCLELALAEIPRFTPLC